MDCNVMREELLAYHFGTSDLAPAADAHLLECKECLAAFLSLRRTLAVNERPSDAVRTKLRAEVARTFRPSFASRLHAWLARPVPRYQTVAFAALAVAVIALLSVERPPPSPKPGALVDSANQKPESFDFY